MHATDYAPSNLKVGARWERRIGGSSDRPPLTVSVGEAARGKTRRPDAVLNQAFVA
jgi:hypothetical protein